MTIRVDWVTSESAFASIQGLWDDLLPRSGSDTVFLTHEWLWAWWQQFKEGRRLAVGVCCDDGEPIGLAPLAVSDRRRADERWTVEFLGEPVSDVHDMLFTRNPRECAQALWEALPQIAPEASYVDLRLLPGGSPTIQLLRDSSHPRWWTAETQMPVLEQTAPWITLDDGWDAYMASRAASLRTDIRRQFKRLSALGDVRLVEARTPEAVDALLSELAGWSRRRFPRRNPYDDARVRAFYGSFAAEALRRGWLEASSLMAGDTTVAVHFGFAYRGTFHYYQPAMNSDVAAYSPGKLLLSSLIERSIARGLRRVDLGRGGERYKQPWATGEERLCRFELIPKRAESGARFLLRRARHAASQARHHLAAR